MAAEKSDDTVQIGVVGAGLMGTSIACVFAAAGRHVVLVDSVQAQLDRVPGEVARIAGELAGAGLLEDLTPAAMAQAVQTSIAIEPLAACGFVFEAVPERLQLKMDLYSRLESVLRPEAIVASNTSGLMPSDLSAEMRHPERFVVAHFWNPPHAVPLVEVVPSPRTDASTIARTVDLLQRVGQEPVVVRKEIPGFIGNRLQYALLREALAIVHSGAASPAEVDAVMRASLGRRFATTGPIETADLGGLETFLTISEYLMPQLAADLEALEPLRAHVAAGEVGLRSGQGFYPWPAERVAEVRGRRDRDLLRRRLEDRREGRNRSS